jgi:hypothetical protein
MLAGNVTAEIVDGDLIVTGDGLDNSIRMSGIEELNGLVGWNDGAGNATSINGTPNGGFDLTGLTRNVIIRMADGNDQVSFHGTFPGAFVIEAGNGNDGVGSMGLSSIATELILNMGPGANEIVLFGREGFPSANLGFAVGTSAILTGGDGRDVVTLQQFSVATDLVINTGAAVDLVDIQRIGVGSFLGIDTGAADDQILASGYARTISIQMGEGSGYLSMTCYASADLGIMATGQSTFIGLGLSRVDGSTYIATGQGYDYIIVNACQLNALHVSTSRGSDQLSVSGSILEQLFADLGDDSDWLVSNYTAVNNQATLQGGLGFDVFTSSGNAFRRLQLGSFEV